ncbi:MAG: hypothetical protein US89_C0001G0069 [Candidatus Peregrinibacteria bacterium GW2011_GWF2_38_29]|nr:MAG: hypothetical protein US89_C0001G0069 [Candidatus Peregrinibacteria bacterium GW2011_GWF2_38_29]HBB03104.1 hypothetical protein [Candidatus Peregrinibacteria bacterium]
MNLKKLLENKNLYRKKISLSEIDKTIGQAHKALCAAEILLSSGKNIDDMAFKEAYDAMILAGRALLFSFGLKPRTACAHISTVNFCESYFGISFAVFIKKFENMRRKRNYLIYGIGLCISDIEAQKAVVDARNFIDLIEKEIAKNRKQQKLV